MKVRRMGGCPLTLTCTESSNGKILLYHPLTVHPWPPHCIPNLIDMTQTNPICNQNTMGKYIANKNKTYTMAYNILYI